MSPVSSPSPLSLPYCAGKGLQQNPSIAGASILVKVTGIGMMFYMFAAFMCEWRFYQQSVSRGVEVAGVGMMFYMLAAMMRAWYLYHQCASKGAGVADISIW